MKKQQHYVTTVQGFLRQLDLKTRPRQFPIWVYRGQGEDKPLVPSLFRYKSIPRGFGNDWRHFEELLLVKFKTQALPFLNPVPPSIKGWIALAQHHGVPTRLLDWTENPLVALYFAIRDDWVNQDSVVWRINVSSTHHERLGGPTNDTLEQMNIDAQFTHIQLSEGIGIVYPEHVTRRISVQQGCFTSHAVPDKAEPFTPLEQNAKTEFPKYVLEKFCIPCECRATIKKELSMLGITELTLFPDLDGLARSIRYEIDRVDSSKGE